MANYCCRCRKIDLLMIKCSYSLQKQTKPLQDWWEINNRKIINKGRYEIQKLVTMRYKI